MKIAFIIYNGITVLDFIGVFDPLTRLHSMGFANDIHCDVCALQKKITSFEGLEIVSSLTGPALIDYDYIIVPGGNGVIDLIQNQDFLNWIKTAGSDAVYAAVCGGSLLLGAAGLLNDKTATTHPSLYRYLEKFAGRVSEDRIVEDGNVITARGVTSALDLGLYLCERIAGKEVRKQIQKQMDYPHYIVD